MPKTKKREVLRINVSVPGTRNGIRLQINNFVDVAGIGGVTNDIKVFKEIGKQKLSKAIEYRNTTRICVDCLQSSLKKEESHCPSRGI